jgi:hypothetical protein
MATPRKTRRPADPSRIGGASVVGGLARRQRTSIRKESEARWPSAIRVRHQAISGIRPPGMALTG